MHVLLFATALALAAAPTPVTLHRDLAYGDESPRQVLDVYVPEKLDRPSRAPLPYLVFVHGGGWSEGHKGKGTRRGKLFARHGFVYASLNYRLSPAVRHPVHVQDVAKALAWLREHAERFGADPDRMYLLGHSAGAHLSALVATDERRLGQFGQKPSDFIRGVVLLDGSGYDVLERIPRSRGWSRRIYLQAFGHDPEAWKDASPLHHVEGDERLPPFLLFHVLGRAAAHRQAKLFAERLRQVGATVHVVGVAGRNHVSILKRLGLKGDPVARRMVAFLDDLEDAAGRTLPPPPPLEPVPGEAEDPDEPEPVTPGAPEAAD